MKLFIFQVGLIFHECQISTETKTSKVKLCTYTCAGWFCIATCMLFFFLLVESINTLRLKKMKMWLWLGKDGGTSSSGSSPALCTNEFWFDSQSRRRMCIWFPVYILAFAGFFRGPPVFTPASKTGLLK